MYTAVKMIVTSKEASFLPLIIFTLYSLRGILCDDTNGFGRDKKQFSLFSVVTFPNEECSSVSTYNGGQIKGTCFSTSECTDKGGTMSGNCASGFGVCCVFVHSLLTSVTIDENRTYVENPLFPSYETSGAGTTITYTISKMRSDICQIRLDFENFSIAGPGNTGEMIGVSQDGNCNDKWTTTTLNGYATYGFRTPTVCGVMTGQHMYIDMGMESTDTAVIALSLASATTITAGVDGITVANAFRKWRVKTAQIPCWASYRAPEGCQQYFTSLVGQIVSPNFSRDPAGSGNGANQLNSGIDLMNINMKYCIRRAVNHCCVLYQVCNQYEGTQFVTPVIAGGNVVNGEAGIISEGWSFHSYTFGATNDAADYAVAENDLGYVDAACTTDYLEIPDSHTGVKSFGAAVAVNTRYCGHRLGFIPSQTAIAGNNNHSPIWDCTEPFEATYYTDTVNDAGAQEAGTQAAPPTNALTVLRGMCLDFKQEAC